MGPYKSRAIRCIHVRVFMGNLFKIVLRTYPERFRVIAQKI